MANTRSRTINYTAVLGNYNILRLQLTLSPPCWKTINKRPLMSFIVPVIRHGRQGLCYLNLWGMGANHLFDVYSKRQKIASLILQSLWSFRISRHTKKKPKRPLIFTSNNKYFLSKAQTAKADGKSFTFAALTPYFIH